MLKRYLKWVIDRLGYDVRKRADKAKSPGRHAYRDIKAYSVGGESPTIFDVGANVGQTVAEFRKVFAAPIIHSFEPDPETFAQLLARAGTGSTFFPNNFALGSQSGSGVFVRNQYSRMSSFLEPGVDARGEVLGRKELPIVTLDDYIGTKNVEVIDILKSDTQGYELEVLKGATRAFACNRVHMVYVEIIFSDMYEGMPRFDEILKLLLDSRFRLVSFYDIFYQNDRASWTDALFINPKFARSVH